MTLSKLHPASNIGEQHLHAVTKPEIFLETPGLCRNTTALKSVTCSEVFSFNSSHAEQVKLLAVNLKHGYRAV